MMYRDLIRALKPIFSGHLSEGEQLLTAIQVVAWARLSLLGKLTDDLNLYASSQSFPTIFTALAKHPEWATAFSHQSRVGQVLGNTTLSRLLMFLDNRSLKTPWAAIDFADYVCAEYSGKIAPDVPSEIRQLMLALADPQNTDAVYLPFESSFQLSAAASLRTTTLFADTAIAEPFPWLMNLLCDTDIQIHQGNALRNPGFREQNTLRKFRVTIAFPPLGAKVSEDLSQTDPFGRFWESTTLFSALALQHVCARTTHRAVIVVPNTFLSGSATEQRLRQTLLNQRRVSTVIALPPALVSWSSVPFSLLVLELDTRCEQVLFIDGSVEQYYSKDGKGRNTLTGWKQLADMVEDGPEHIRKRVAVEEILANNALLQVSRYCEPKSVEAIKALYTRYEDCRELGGLVEIIRPAPLAQVGQGYPADELSPGDFPEIGFAEKAGRQVALRGEGANSKTGNAFLCARDLVIAIKGSIGKIAIVSLDHKVRPWVAGQSCMVLRSYPGSPIDPRVLYLFLRSDAAQTLIRQLNTGATVPLIPLKGLAQIRVPIPFRHQQLQMIDDFERVIEIERQIDNLRAWQKEIMSNHWTP